MTFRHTSRPGRRSASPAGFTLMEVLVAMMLTGIVMAAATSALIMTFRTVGETNARLTSSGSALQTNAYFAGDIANAFTSDGSKAIGRGKEGCGGDPTSFLRTIRMEGGIVKVQSYSLGTNASGATLERRTCEGSTVPTATAPGAAGRTAKVVNDLGSGDDAVTVTCRQSPNATPSPATDEGDAKCHLVAMTVRTRTGYTFTVEGQRDKLLGVDEPSAVTTLKQCTLVASADASVTSFRPNVNDGTSWRIDTFRRAGGPLMTGKGDVLGFLKVDLLGPCAGADEPAFLPGGKRLLSADLQLYLFRNSNPDSAGNESTHRLRMVSEYWDEATVTWTTKPAVFDEFTKPAGFDTAPTHWFSPQRPFPGRRALHNDVLAETRYWYGGPTGDGQVNWGWRLDRGDGNWGDNGGDGGFSWGAHDSSDEYAWPKLTVTWK